jgi:hypothetical protein
VYGSSSGISYLQLRIAIYQQTSFEGSRGTVPDGDGCILGNGGTIGDSLYLDCQLG